MAIPTGANSTRFALVHHLPLAGGKRSASGHWVGADRDQRAGLRGGDRGALGDDGLSPASSRNSSRWAWSGDFQSRCDGRLVGAEMAAESISFTEMKWM